MKTVKTKPTKYPTPPSPPENDLAVITSEKDVKKKQKRRRKTAEDEENTPRSFKQDLEIQKQLDALHDDIVSMKTSPQRDQQQQQQISTIQRENKIFIEMQRGFKEVKLTDGEIDVHDVFQPMKRKPHKMKKIDLALKIHQTCHKLISLLHGLITGVALWECVVVYSIRPPFFPHDDFASHFSMSAPIVQRVFLIGLVICLVDVLDAGDLVRIRESLISHLIRERISIFLTFLYSASFILTVLTSDVETRYSEYLSEQIVNSTEWEVNLNEHETWWILTVCRAVFLSLSFVVISLSTRSESLTNFLLEIKRSEI